MAKWQASKGDVSPRKGYIPEIEIEICWCPLGEWCDSEHEEETKMYEATVTMKVYGLSDNYEQEIHQLLDSLALVETKQVWDNVDWIISEVETE